jgi:hypothetical protein
MGRIGSGENGQLTFLDLISILSFWIGIENLDMNITQEDIQETTTILDEKLKKEVDDIHSHLSIQDAKLNHIIGILEELKNDKN